MSLFLALLKQEKIPAPCEEWVFAHPRRFRFDYAWPEQRLALEVEGGIFTRKAHGSITGILRDMEKYNLAAVHGWRVLRVTPNKLCDLQTIAMVGDAYRCHWKI
jgi:very-short-patch-repair endonuclease